MIAEQRSFPPKVGFTRVCHLKLWLSVCSSISAEYAMEAIAHAGTVIGVQSKEGVVLAAEKKVTGKLLDTSVVKEGGYGGSGEKIFLLNNNLIAGVAGLSADANSLVNYSRTSAQQHLFSFNEDIPVEQLVQKLCNLKQGYTQFGGLRPFGVSLLYAGYDPHYEFQLYHSDPSGNYSGWKATCIGANNGTAQSLLKQEYKDEISLDDAISLVIRVMGKTMDSTTLSSEKLEFAVITLDADTKKPKAKIYRPVEVDALLDKLGVMKKDDEEMNRESREEEEKQKRQKRAELKKSNETPPAAPNKSLDSSLKRHSALIKRLRQSLGADNRDQVLKDVDSLSLEKYVEEIVQASVDGMSRCKTEKDIWSATEIVSAFHRRFPEAYTPPLVAILSKELAAPSRTALNSLSSEQREKDEAARIVRQRPLLRVACELAMVGIINDSPGRSGGEWIMKVIRELLVNDPSLGSLPLFTTFLKSYSRPFLGLAPPPSAKQVGADVEAGELSSTVAQESTNGVSNGATILNEQEELVEKDIRDKFKRMCEGYYENVAKKLVKEHNRLQDQDRRNHEAYIKSGEIFEDRQQAYEKMTKSYEKLLSSCQSLSDLLYLPMPHLPSASQKNDSILLLDGSSSLRLGGTEDLPANSKWEDEEERRFYEDLPDLKDFVPKTVLGVDAVASKEERDSVAKEQVNDADAEKAKEEQEKRDVARLEARLENVDGEDAKTTVSDDAEDQPSSRSPSPTQGAATGASQVLAALLARLSDANNRTVIDEIAVNFAFLNSKASRKRLIKFLNQPPKNRTDILPYFARLVAILNPYMPDVGSELVALLEDEFRYLQKKKKLVKELAPNRMKNVHYLSALAKFKIVPPHLILHVFKVYLDDLTGVNVDNAAMLLEGCGRFLLRSEDTGSRMATMLELMRRKQSVQHFDQRQILLLENAYYQCNPPERAPRVEKERSAMEMFIRHLIYDVLAKKTIDKVLKLIRKVNWNDPEVYAVLLKVFNKPWKVKYSNVSLLAMLAYDLQRYHPEFSIRVVDHVLEDIRLGMEQNIYKNNQRRVASIKYLGELYMYRLISSTLIFDTLWSLVTFGHPDGRPLPGQVSPIDAPNDFFRIRLACVLLDTCGMCFDQGSQKRKLDNYITFLQLYVHCKAPLPMEVDFMLNDTLEALRPKLTLFKSFEEAAVAVDSMFDLVDAGLEDGDNGDESDRGGDESGDENDADRRKAQRDDASDIDVSDLKEDNRPGSPEALLIVNHAENAGPTEEAEAEFVKELAKMFVDAPGERRVDRKSIWEGPSLPTGVRKKRGEDDSEQGQPGMMKFTIATRKGNKVQTRQLPVPIDTELVRQTREMQLQDKAEQQQLKRIVLDYEHREEAEEQKAFEDTMRERGIKIRFT
ncbi:Up-frameshift suppressor 2 [Rhizoctonia solani]|uniref:Up-frameshift suppressor 2 n=2 Tax=Rhizoctonia solani TaxID=456999 RepID=A0A8H7H767_9AGAM|nr:Up-frameshift suppressor 2 [Rhizoctonia solani]